MAPEVLADLNDYVHKSADIWSLGAMIVELITGFPPFHEVSPIKVCFGILEGSVDPIEDHIPGISKLLFSFLNCCFQIPPDSRPSVTELLAHPWLNQSSPSATPHLSSFIPHLPSHSHSTHSYSVCPSLPLFPSPLSPSSFRLPASSSSFLLPPSSFFLSPSSFLLPPFSFLLPPTSSFLILISLSFPLPFLFFLPFSPFFHPSSPSSLPP